MNLSPLQSKSTALFVKIICINCSKSATYADAMHAGWMFDKDGKPFTDYYCPTCAKKMLQSS